MSAVMLRVKCRLCECVLDASSPRDDLDRALCGDCQRHPAARHLRASRGTPVAAKPTTREFTVADRTLVRRVQAYMAPAQLLHLLNERLQADSGDPAASYTMDQLHALLRDTPAPSRAPSDWSDLRRHLAQARRDGVLNAITAKSIDDFGVVFALSQAQLVRVKDVVLSAKEEARG